MQSDANADATVGSGQAGLGRRIMLLVGVTIVAISGGIGWFVGSNGSAVLSEAAVLGTSLTIPVTPLSVALYGVVVSSGLLGVLFGLVEVASRLEDGDPLDDEAATGGSADGDASAHDGRR